jgi:hypothetical protein
MNKGPVQQGLQKCLGFRGSAMSSQFGLNRVHIGTTVR